MPDFTMTLEEEFTARLWDACRTTRSLGYVPIIFERMLREHKGLRTAKKLIASGEIQDGFKKVVRLNRPDLTMESIMLESKFRDLFTKEELAAADWRLKQTK